MKKSTFALLALMLLFTVSTGAAAKYKCINYAGNGYFSISNGNIASEPNTPHTWFLIKNGKKIPNIKSSSFMTVPEDGFVMVNRKGLEGIVDMHGKTVLPFTRHYIYYLGNSLYAINKNDDTFVIWNRKTGAKSRAVEGFCKSQNSDGLIRFSKKDKWGFCNAAGKIIIPPDYDYACDFSEGLAAVCKIDKWGFIDTYGREVIPFTYDTGDSWYDDGSEPDLRFKNGICAVINETAMGVISKLNKVIVPFEYSYITIAQNKPEIKAELNQDNGREDTYSLTGKLLHTSPLRNQLVPGLYRNFEGRKQGLTDEQGNIIVPTKYDIIIIKDEFVICQDFGVIEDETPSVDIYAKNGKLIYNNIAFNYLRFLF